MSVSLAVPRHFASPAIGRAFSRALGRALVSAFFGLVAAGLALPAAAGPRIDTWTAPSGAKVLFVESHVLPVVDVQVDFAAGSAYAPAGKAGVAGLTRGLLSQGAGNLSEQAIADRLADLGAQLGGGVDPDRASLSLRTLSDAPTRDGALAVLRTVLVAPAFPADVVARERDRAVAALKESLTRPETLASRAFWQNLYGDHPYGRQATPESIAALTRDDLAAYWKARYTARRATVTLVGDLTRAQAEAVAQDLTAGLPAEAANGGASLALPAVTPPKATTVAVAHPAAQSHLFIGSPTFKRGDPDFFPLVVGNYVLGGGGFVSRLMKEVREKRGYAYSVYSYFLPLKEEGPFQIGLQTKRDQAGAALKVVRDTLAEFIAKGPTESELQAAKDNLVGGFPLRLDSNRKLLDQVATIGFYGLPLDWLDRYTERVKAVTVTQIKDAFARHVQDARLVTVEVATDLPDAQAGAAR